jgi:predicted PurR-regulated permease PerM
MLSRKRGKELVVLAATVDCVYICYRLAEPFIPALVWAITIAVVTQPIVKLLDRRIKSRSWRAIVAVCVVTIAVFAPVVSLVYLAAIQIGQAVQNWRLYLDRWQNVVSEKPRLAEIWERISQDIDLTGTVEQFAGAVHNGTMAVASGSVHSVVQALITIFLLFYLYRDGDRLLLTARQLSPLTDKETDGLLKRLSDTIHATIFGTVMVAIIQGVLGGIMFWMLGLPGAVLWGTVMALLAIVPYLGAFIVWVPAAAFLAIQGQWWKMLVLVVWGTIVVGLIDNLIYPVLVGNRLRQHTVIAFVAIVGGISVFGAAGLILGPVVVSLTVFLLETWRRRTEGGGAAEEIA